MIIGAPGVYNWTGTVIRVSDHVSTSTPGIPSRRKKRQDDEEVINFGEALVPEMEKISQFKPSDYFGKMIQFKSF